MKRSLHARQADALRLRAKRAGKPRHLTARQWRQAKRCFPACAYCGQPFDAAHPPTADHFIPLSQSDSPGSVAANIVPVCYGCNQAKADRDPLEFLTTTFGAARAATLYSQIQTYFTALKER
jgi:5-methylcytosine-specific restriction endonuclease McrA